MTRWTEADVARVTGKVSSAGQAKKTPAKTLHGNVRCTWQEHVFDSQRERDAFVDFRTQQLAGAIRSVIRQVSMPLMDSTRRIRIDFLVIENDGKHRWFDAKGFSTKEWNLKNAMVREGYGITIELI